MLSRSPSDQDVLYLVGVELAGFSARLLCLKAAAVATTRLKPPTSTGPSRKAAVRCCTRLKVRIGIDGVEFGSQARSAVWYLLNHQRALSARSSHIHVPTYKPFSNHVCEYAC